MSRTCVESKDGTTRISRLAVLFWILGALSVPTTLFVRSWFDSLPGNADGGDSWAPGLPILIAGFAVITPTMIACGSFTLLSAECRKRGSTIWALFFASLTGILLASAVALVAWLVLTRDDPGVVLPNGDYSVRICRETRFERFNSEGDIDFGNGKTGRCASDARALSERYLSQNDKVYWLTKNTHSSPPCISGTGDPSAIAYNFSWRCMTSRPNQVDEHEDRTLVLLGRYTPGFQVYSGLRVAQVDWQREQFEHYATDGTSVYFENEKLTGVAPHQFSPYFPFGGDERWHRFYFSKSGSTVYLDGKPIPDIDLAQFTLLEPTRCPGHGLSCTWEYSLDCDHGYWGCRGLLGRVGTDVVYLQRNGVTVFKGMAADDLFMFMTSKRVYFHSNGKFYEVVRDGLDRSATLADMDVAIYETAP